MNSRSDSYGTTRQRPASVSYADIDAAARSLMLAGGYPSVGAVRNVLKRGSTTTIADAMRRFWKDQAALNVGNPVSLTRLPPEFADAAVALWEQALRLSQLTALIDDNAARALLEQRRRDVDQRARSMEMREKEWDVAARLRERALADTRDQVNVLMKELAADRAELRLRDARILDLETQMEAYRQQVALLVTRAVARNRALRTKRPAPRSPKKSPSKSRIRPKKLSRSKRSKRGARR